ncbi:hypothetical protein M3C36_09085 [Dietzia cinnamea]|uniref:hypothetical protein n=1 Tax=Dietzia TaxID=37914 RepID=UPI000D08C493|nr:MULTISPECIES: hypothetical protein [Dietzia]AVM66092.1 hypothetical protein C3V38_16165 [Dietzia sp. oral taxon 368]MCT1885339.1 hypothetical protein [Dietzia cinnamea]
MFSLKASPMADAMLTRALWKPAPATDLDAYAAVLHTVDDAAAWEWNGIPAHVEPFFQSGDDTPDALFVSARFGALAASLMVELDTEQLARADTWGGVLEMVTDDLNDAHASLLRSFPPAPPRADGLGQRLVNRDSIRAEIDDNPNLTESQRLRLMAALDSEIDDAIEACTRSVEDQLYAVHDELQALVVADLTS